MAKYKNMKIKTVFYKPFLICFLFMILFLLISNKFYCDEDLLKQKKQEQIVNEDDLEKYNSFTNIILYTGIILSIFLIILVYILIWRIGYDPKKFADKRLKIYAFIFLSFKTLRTWDPSRN